MFAAPSAYPYRSRGPWTTSSGARVRGGGWPRAAGTKTAVPERNSWREEEVGQQNWRQYSFELLIITYIPRPRRPWPSAWGAHAAAGGTGGGGGRPPGSFPDLQRTGRGRLMNEPP